MNDPEPVDPNAPSTWDALTPATKRLNELIDINPKPRQLTPVEVELLLQSKRELAELAFATLTRASTHKLVADKRALCEASTPLVTEAQRAELRARLAHHRAHPEDPGITFAQLKTKLQSNG